MKKLIPIILLLTPWLFVGCGGDDDGPTDGGTSVTVLVADSTATEPAMVSANEAAWDGVDSVTLDVVQGAPPAKVATVTNAIMVKAIRASGKLYLRLQWNDPTFNVFRDAYILTDTLSPPPDSIYSLRFSRWTTIQANGNEQEDQAAVLFSMSPDPGWDVWNWRVLTTAAGNFGEGQTWVNDTLHVDAGDPAWPLLDIKLQNPQVGGGEPTYVSKDTSEFNGWILYSKDAIDRQDTIFTASDDTVFWPETHNWPIGVKVPGWLIDSAAVDRAQTQGGSRWDIRSVYEYDSTAGMYAVVMERDMNTTYEDDLNLEAVDSVKVTIGVFDDQSDFTLGSNRRGFSAEFYLKFK